MHGAALVYSTELSRGPLSWYADVLLFPVLQRLPPPPPPTSPVTVPGKVFHLSRAYRTRLQVTVAEWLDRERHRVGCGALSVGASRTMTVGEPDPEPA
jgi:hypothetical protein